MGRLDEARGLLQRTRTDLLEHHSARHDVLPRVELELARVERASRDVDAALMILDELLQAYAEGARSTRFVSADTLEAARSALLEED